MSRLGIDPLAAPSLRALALLASLALLPASSSAQSVSKPPEFASQAETLKGVTAVSVDVDVYPLTDNLQRQLTESIETGLWWAGVKILPKGTLPKLRVVATTLDFQITQGFRPPSDYTIFAFNVEFYQELLLLSGPHDWASAITWKVLSGGVGNGNGVDNIARKAIESVVDTFMRDLKEQNPRLPAPRMP